MSTTLSEDKTDGGEGFMISFSERQGQKAVGITVNHNIFENIVLWKNHKLGKSIQKILTSGKFKNHFKCIYFWNEVGNNEFNDWTINAKMMDVFTPVYQRQDKGNIVCLTNCNSCDRITTVEFSMEDYPRQKVAANMCEECFLHL